MILLYNVYLDDKIRVPGLYYRGNYGDYNDSISVFKYALSSVVDIYPWTRVIINVEINPTLSHRENELFDYIKTLFKEHDLILTNTRCNLQSDWKKLYNNINDELIYFCCNHDHIFVDKDPTNFIADINAFKKQFSESEASFYFSHWQEALNLFTKNKIHSPNSEDISEDSYILTDEFLITVSNNIDSVQIITKKLYYSWWFTGEFEHIPFPRTDYANFHGHDFPNKPFKFQIIPYREYFRHFDGYTHIDYIRINNIQHIAGNIVCPLFIPHGFFENNLKLRVGYNDVKENFININLEKENYTVIDNNGTDLKCFYDEIPFFWKNKISQLDLNPNYNESNFQFQRNNNIFYPLICGLFHDKITDSLLINNIKQANNINDE